MSVHLEDAAEPSSSSAHYPASQALCDVRRLTDGCYTAAIADGVCLRDMCSAFSCMLGRKMLCIWASLNAHQA